jgi:hypothetical protein
MSHGVEDYVDGKIIPPDPKLDPKSAKNWRANDTHACSIIVGNIAESQIMHTNPCKTSHEMWEALRAMHEQHGFQTAINYIRILFKSSVSEDGDIP